MCSNYFWLKDCTILNRNPIPTIYYMQMILPNTIIYSKIEVLQAYQNPLAQEDRKK